MSNAALWDIIIDYNHLDSLADSIRSQRLTHLDISTVRANSITESPLGDLYWVLVAKYLEQHAGIGKVTIHDFQNGHNNHRRETIRELSDIFQFNDVSIIYEEDAIKDPTLFDRLVNLPALPGQHFPEIAEGLEAYKSGDTLRSMKKLQRLMSEISIFLTGGDDSHRLQIMNHEEGTMQFIRSLEPSVRKRFARLDLTPIKNEYRGYVSAIGDLYRKILIGANQKEGYNGFYLQTASLFARVLLQMSPKPVVDESADLSEKQESLDQSLREQVRYIEGKIDAIDKHLRPAVAMEIHKYSTEVLHLSPWEANWVPNIILVGCMDEAYNILDEMNQLQRSFDRREVQWAADLHRRLLKATGADYAYKKVYSDQEPIITHLRKLEDHLRSVKLINQFYNDIVHPLEDPNLERLFEGFPYKPMRDVTSRVREIRRIIARGPTEMEKEMYRN